MKTKKGFTLMEIVVGLVILSVLAVGMISLFIHAKSGIFTADEKMIAVQAAEKALIDQKGKSADEFRGWEKGEKIVDGLGVPQLKSGKLTVQVVNDDAGVTDTLKEITATVTWSDPSGAVRKVEVATAVYKSVT